MTEHPAVETSTQGASSLPQWLRLSNSIADAIVRDELERILKESMDAAHKRSDQMKRDTRLDPVKLLYPYGPKS